MSHSADYSAGWLRAARQHPLVMLLVAPSALTVPRVGCVQAAERSTALSSIGGQPGLAALLAPGGRGFSVLTYDQRGHGQSTTSAQRQQQLWGWLQSPPPPSSGSELSSGRSECQTHACVCVFMCACVRACVCMCLKACGSRLHFGSGGDRASCRPRLNA